MLVGTVYFVGKPCPPRPDGRARLGPPCDGPYPGYEIAVHAADGETVVARTTADERGRFRVELPPGAYVIHTPGGVDPRATRATTVAITSGATTHADLKVDTGVR